MIRNCNYCGKEFSKSGKHRKHCSIDCQLVYQRQKPESIRASRESDKRRMESLPDSMVKKSIYIASKGNIKYDQMTMEMIKEKRQSLIEYRSKPKIWPSCKVYFKEYDICGEMFTTWYKKAKICSDECRHMSWAKYQREIYKPKPKVERICRVCGETFETNGTIKCCSSECLIIVEQTDKIPRKRARLNGVFYELVIPLKVFIRDGWRCQLCGKKLKPKYKGTLRDDAPELDHIIPWDKDGEHSYRNTQCACRKCNQEKGAVECGQLRMFG